MKINITSTIKFLTAAGFLSCVLSNLTYAFSCNQDVRQMYAQVHKYGSITSTDGKLFTNIVSVFESEEACTAEGYYAYGSRREPRFICRVEWKKGDWGNTLTCI